MVQFIIILMESNEWMNILLLTNTPLITQEYLMPFDFNDIYINCFNYEFNDLKPFSQFIYCFLILFNKIPFKKNH